jgi:hypothetical protein
VSAARRLARALEASARAAGCRLALSGAIERPWASATFVGAHHALEVDGAPTEALLAWLAALPETAIAVPGHVVADLVVRGSRVEALVLEA